MNKKIGSLIVAGLAIFLLSTEGVFANIWTEIVGPAILLTGNSAAMATPSSPSALVVPHNLMCENAPCAFILQASVQVSGTAGTEWSICSIVDGVPANVKPNCSIQGTLSPTGSTGSVSQSAIVGAGSHTVQTSVYVQSNSAKIGSWQVLYTQLGGHQ
jgi:hypothetical protein